ncbi:MAG: LLM class flavin-dependent oxidoreductase [Acidimicrobiales bacterium]|nr:LLM class flavin-dependent oxidoreductase [Acidimicrobiales bacterium]
MQIGLFLDLRNPEQWRRPWATHYADTLALVERAEELGLDSVWLTEHHLFADGYLPQPLTLASAIAARTSRIRIGTAVLLGALRPAIQIAEEAAIVDLVSGGRLELGLGAGYVSWEFDAYGVDIAERYRITDRRITELRELLDGGTVTPPPLQRPFPLWLGYQGPQGARRAGRLGVGLLCINPDLLDTYRTGLAEGGHDPDSARMKGLVSIIVADDPDDAYERILPHLAHQLNTYREAGSAAMGRSPKPLTVDKLRDSRRAVGGVIPPLEVLTPGEAIDRLREMTAGLPVEEVYLWASIAGMDDDLVARHVELLATEVRPAFVSTGAGS